MAEYPTRQFSASDAYTSYMKSLEEAEKKKKAYNIVHNMYKLTNPHYSGSSEESSNLSKISKLGSGTSSGLATRLRLMTAADKENLGMEFTGAFQQALESDLFTSLKSFNTWANKQGPWYDEDLRRKHATTVKDMLDAQKSNKVAEAVDTLFSEHKDAWAVGGYNEQTQILTDIADSEVIKNLPSRLRKFAIEAATDSLTKFRSPMGRYAAAGEARSVQQEKDRIRTLADAEADETLKETSEALSAKVVQEAIGLKDEDSNLTRDEALNKAIAMVVPRGRTQILDEQQLKRRFDLFIPKKDSPPGTKPVYDPVSDSTIFATDAEIAADDSLVPTAAESNLDPDTARIGALMAVKGEMPNDVWKKYYKGGMDLLYNSLAGPDAEHIKKWLLQVEEYKAKTAAGVGINLQLLQGGAVTGQTDDGITNVRIKQ